MANSYTQIHIQYVFVVKFRDGLIHPKWKEELFKYISGIIKFHNHKLLAINGVENHIHVLVGMKPTQTISELAQVIKANSSKWINETKMERFRFEWQAGFGAFSYSKWDVEKIINYIQNQEEHHKKKTFKEEYLKFLEDFEIDFDEKYIFQEPI
ncbi:MAG: IS200/IS605 family transposase [Flavobacteriia bacterium]|jgi:putative transposase